MCAALKGMQSILRCLSALLVLSYRVRAAEQREEHSVINTTQHVTVNAEKSLSNSSAGCRKQHYYCADTTDTQVGETIKRKASVIIEDSPRTASVCSLESRLRKTRKLKCNLMFGDERERRSPLPEIIRSSYPHLG